MRGSAGKKNGIIYPNWREKWVDLNKNEKDQIIKHVDILPMHPSFTLLLTIRETDPVPLFSTIGFKMVSWLPLTIIIFRSFS